MRSAVLEPTGRLVGRTEPRIFTPPLRPLTRKTSLGYAVCDFMEQVVGDPPLPWHRFVLVHALEIAPPYTLDDPGWRFRFRTILILAARQNGKTWLSRAVSMFKLFVLGVALVVGTAQDVSIARKILELINQTVESVPELDDEKITFRRSNGNEGLILTGHREYLVKATHEDAGRSLTVDHLNLDELRTHKTWAAWSALTKTTNAVPNGQVWAFSNMGDQTAVVLNQLRANAHAGTTGSLFLAEYSAPEGCALDDEDGWCQANPALGYLISEEALRSSLETDPPDIFRVECLCQAVDQLDGAVDLAAWKTGADATGSLEALRDRLVACVDVAPDGQHVSLAAGGVMPDGRVRLEMLGAWSSTEAARAELGEIVAAVKPVRLAWFPGGPSAALGVEIKALDGYVVATPAETTPCANPLCNHDVKVGAYCCAPCALADEKHYEIHESGPLGHSDDCHARLARRDNRLRRHRIQVVELTGAEVTAACMEFADLVASRRIVHPGDPLLDAHIAGAKQYRVGDGWRFVRRGAGHVDAAYSAAGCVHVLRGLPAPRKRVKMVV